MISLALYRVLTIALGTFENLLLSGIFFGWVSLVYVVKQEGYFSHLCPPKNTSFNLPETEGITRRPTGVPDIPSDPTQASTTLGSAVTSGRYPTCPEQDAELQLVFTIATFCYAFLLFPLGMVLDKFGTFIMRLLSSCLIITGLLLIAFSSMETAFLLFPAVCFLGVGGVELMFVNLQISNLFGRRKATVMTFLSGCLDSSAFVFTIVKLLYESLGVPLQTSFFVLAGVSLLMCFNTLLLPKIGHIPYPLPPGYRQSEPLERGGAESHEGADNKVAMAELDRKETNGQLGKELDSTEATDENELDVVPSPSDKDAPSSQSITEATKSLRYPSLCTCWLSLPSLCLLIWFSLLQLTMFFFLGTLNPGLERLADNDQNVVSTYTTVLAIFQACSIAVAPFCGILLDRNRTNKSMTGCKRGPYDDLLDSRIVFTLTTLLYVAFNVTLVINVIEVRYVSFILHVITRSFMYSLIVTGCALFFPIQYFGSTTGLVMSLASIFGLLQRPMYAIQQDYLDNDPFWIFIGLIVLNLITFILPVYIHIYVKQASRSFVVEGVKRA